MIYLYNEQWWFVGWFWHLASHYHFYFIFFFFKPLWKWESFSNEHHWFYFFFWFDDQKWSLFWKVLFFCCSSFTLWFHHHHHNQREMLWAITYTHTIKVQIYCKFHFVNDNPKRSMKEFNQKVNFFSLDIIIITIIIELIEAVIR